MIVANKPHLIWDRNFKCWICVARDFYPMVFVGLTRDEAYNHYLEYQDKLMREELDWIHEHPEFLQ